MESSQDQTDHKEALIYKLLTLKAEHLGEDLHNEIEKIIDQVYATVTEQDIRDFADKYKKDYGFGDKELKSVLWFDLTKKVRAQTLLIAEAYYPKEIGGVPFYLIDPTAPSKIRYVTRRLGYSLKYSHPNALYSLGFAAEDYGVYLPDIFHPDHPFVRPSLKDYEKLLIALPVKTINIIEEYDNEDGTEEERSAFFHALLDKEQEQ